LGRVGYCKWGEGQPLLIVPNLYKYVITHDTGKAPCIDNNLLTLCICKPKIRKTAKVGDWVLATASKQKISREPRIVYAAKITKKITMEQYALENEVRQDKIYSFDGLSLRHNGSSTHSEPYDQKTDIGGVFCLVSNEFWYFGNMAIELPKELSFLYHFGRGHSKIRDQLLLEVTEKYFSGIEPGILGKPNHIKR